MLDNALKWAKKYVSISKHELNVIKQAKKSFLFANNTLWQKKGEDNFDIGMGAYDGAETCDLIGLYILHQLSNQIKGLEVGLYRDDGLVVIETTPRLADKIRQQIGKILNENRLKITGSANLEQVQFWTLH